MSNGFYDYDELMETCSDMRKELSTTNKASTINESRNKKHSLVCAFLLTIFGGVFVWSSFADGYFEWSFAHSNLSGGARYYVSNFITLTDNIAIADLLTLVMFTTVVFAVLSTWITAKMDKHLEMYCVVATSVLLMLVLMLSIWGPIAFTEHEDFRFGFYSYKDFVSYGTIFYVQVASAGASWVASIINRILAQRNTK